jgi:hypothetical protein
MRTFARNLVATAAVAVLATVGLATSAQATSRTQASADVPAVSLTPADKQALQRQLDGHLNDYGAGRQTGINQVSYDNGRIVLTLPLPGETRARAISEPVTPMGVANCAFAHACLWSETNFNGARLDRVACGTIALGAPFNSSTASIHNNQTTNTQTVILNSAQQILNASQAPSRINDTGVGSRGSARFWRVC